MEMKRNPMQCKFENSYEKKVREELFYSGEYSDVTFMVGTMQKRTFKGHRLVLIAGSEKFKKMFELHKTNEPIVIPEIEPEAFDRLLMAIYLHSFQIDSIQTAIDCSKLFENFGLPHAVAQCMEYLHHPTVIDANNAITLYEMNLPTKDNNAETVAKCLNVFSTDTRAVLKSVAFSRAHLDTIQTIFDLPKLNIQSELDLLDALCEFAEMHGALPPHNTDGNADRFAELVAPVLSKIRLMTIFPTDIVKSHSVRSLLTDYQILSILVNNITPENSLYKLPGEISTCKTTRNVETNVNLSQFSDADDGSSVQILADTAQIDSQICETPKGNGTGRNVSVSIDWSSSKIQDVRHKDGSAKVGTPNGNSSHDSSIVLIEANSTLDQNTPVKQHESITCTPDIPQITDENSFRSSNGNVRAIKNVWTKKIQNSENYEFTPNTRAVYGSNSSTPAKSPGPIAPQKSPAPVTAIKSPVVQTKVSSNVADEWED